MKSKSFGNHYFSLVLKDVARRKDPIIKQVWLTLYSLSPQGNS